MQTEAMQDITAPHERFKKAVSVAVFVLGEAPGEPEPSEAQTAERRERERPHPPRKEDRSLEMWFEGVDERMVPQGIRSIIRRMRQNLGHPTNTDLIRTVAAQGGRPEVLAGIRALRCAACLRCQAPSRPRPARMPRFGGFNEKVGMDVFFVRDSQGKSYHMLSILDLSILFHVVVRMQSREPQYVFQLFVGRWLSWAGPMATLLLDQDGSFQGTFIYSCE